MYEKIKKLASEKGVSINKVEKDLGFSSSSISKWDVSTPAADRLAKVAKYFNVSFEELLKESEGNSDAENG